MLQYFNKFFVFFSDSLLTFHCSLSHAGSLALFFYPPKLTSAVSKFDEVNIKIERKKGTHTEVSERGEQEGEEGWGDDEPKKQQQQKMEKKIVKLLAAIWKTKFIF